jgi:multidrug transporter EmrE-like cation transporter
MNLIKGMIYGLLAQILTFLQLQGNIKYNWFEKYPIALLSMSIPISYMFIKSVEYMVVYYNGEIWPSRLIGFAIGIIVFALMSYFIFDEPITLKTLICLILGGCILGIQILWK